MWVIIHLYKLIKKPNKLTNRTQSVKQMYKNVNLPERLYLVLVTNTQKNKNTVILHWQAERERGVNIRDITPAVWRFVGALP